MTNTKIIKTSEICANGQILQTFIVTFHLGICSLKPVALFTNWMCMDIENPHRNAWTLKMLAAFRGSTHFTFEKSR